MQSRLPKFNQSTAKQNLSWSFANLIFVGKTKAALDLFSQAQKGGVLHLNDPSDPNNPDSRTVRDILNRANMPMLNASSLPPRKMCTRSYLTQLMPMPSVLLLCGLPGQQDPPVLMRTNEDACVLSSREHLMTYATHLPWWQKGFVHSTWPPDVFHPSLLAA